MAPAFAARGTPTVRLKSRALDNWAVHLKGGELSPKASAGPQIYIPVESVGPGEPYSSMAGLVLLKWLNGPACQVAASNWAQFGTDPRESSRGGCSSSPLH